MADEVFSGGVSVTGVEPGTTTITIKSTTNPNISKKVPVTVKSRNLLAYGPASGNGLTATVNSDGSLHVKGTTTAWAQISVSVRLDAGTYMLTCDNSNGWNYGAQFGGGNITTQLGGASVKLEAADYGVSLFVAEGKTMDIDLTPRIHRLD